MSAALQASLFDAVTPAQRRRERERLQQRLEPITLALAERRGPEGVIAADVISEAVVRGLLTGQEWRSAPRAYSWVGPWLASLARAGKLAPKMAGPVHARRKSDREASHSNSQLVYVAPRFA
ncbi:MAG TPA: hypothetical protein VJO33_05055 [Gemmatimonadaceae bacterium]|nr:hypothetical protein [Gemmatimonadaceae bacterium]